MYTAKQYRKTQNGWVLDVRYDGAAVDTSISILSDEINARDCRNFADAYQTIKRLDYGAAWGDVYEVESEQERQAAEIASDDEWLQTERRIAFDSDLGTNSIVYGGEVLELDAHLESQYDEQNGDIDLPI